MIVYRVKRKKIIRNKTNDGDLSKQTFSLIYTDSTDIALQMVQLMLTRDHISYRNRSSLGVVELKKFKDVFLFRRSYSIRLSTLNEMLYWLNSMNRRESELKQPTNE